MLPGFGDDSFAPEGVPHLKMTNVLLVCAAAPSAPGLAVRLDQLPHCAPQQLLAAERHA
jgi:hypothetical protein